MPTNEFTFSIHGSDDVTPYEPKAGDIWQKGRRRMVLCEKGLVPGEWKCDTYCRWFFSSFWDFSNTGTHCLVHMFDRDGWTLIHHSPTPK